MKWMVKTLGWIMAIFVVVPLYMYIYDDSDIKKQTSPATWANYYTSTNNGVYAQISIIGGGGMPNTDKEVGYIMMACDTNKYGAFILNKEHACKVELYDANHNLVVKTRKGKNIGSKYDQISTDTNAYKYYSANGRNQHYFNCKGSGWKPLFKLKDVFTTQKPGDYLLSLRLHTVRWELKEPPEMDFHVVEFQESKIPIEIPMD